MNKVFVLMAVLMLAAGFTAAVPEDAAAVSDEHGPQKTGKFVVEFDDDKVAGWKIVTIPSVSIEEGTYREGNEAPQEKKVAGQPTYDDLEMERGAKIEDADIRHGKVDGSRREIAVIVQGTEGNAQTREEMLAQISGLIDDIQEDDKVNFEVEEGDQGPIAVDVEPIYREDFDGLAAYEWRVDGETVSTVRAFDDTSDSLRRGDRFEVTGDDGAKVTNKGELIDIIAADAGLSKADAKRALDAFVERTSDGASIEPMHHTIGEIQGLLEPYESGLRGALAESADGREVVTVKAKKKVLAGDREDAEENLRKVRRIVERDIGTIEEALNDEERSAEKTERGKRLTENEEVVLRKVLKKEKKLLEQTDHALQVVEHENIWINDGSGDGFYMKTPRLEGNLPDANEFKPGKGLAEPVK